MTQDEFISGYCERSGVTWEWLSKHKKALPCACGEDGCEGWAMITNNELSIKAHMDLYAPVTQDTPNGGGNSVAACGVGRSAAE